jgi:tellurite resistance protein
VTAPKIPLNLFGIPFGLAGLGEVWTVLAGGHHAPALAGEVILLVSAVSWLVLVAGYLGYLITSAPPPGWAAFSGDLRDPVAAPFASLALIAGVLLASVGLFPHAAAPARVITDVFIVLTVLLGGWFTGQWIIGPVDLDRFHPGYFLPTVAGGLVAADGAALIGQRSLAEVLFGLGVLCWIMLGSLVMARLLFRPPLPTALQPTMAIEVAPAAVAILDWFALHGARPGPVPAFLAGYGILMVLAQVRLLPAYLRLTFTPSFWAFTFSWAAVAAAGIAWLQGTQPTGYRIWQYVLAAAVTVLIGGIAIRTAIAISRRQLLPRPQAAPANASAIAAPASPASVTAS